MAPQLLEGVRKVRRELEEGVRMVCDLLDADPETIAIGQAVEVRFEDLPGQGPVPRFEVINGRDRG